MYGTVRTQVAKSSVHPGQSWVHHRQTPDLGSVTGLLNHLSCVPHLADMRCHIGQVQLQRCHLPHPHTHCHTTTFPPQNLKQTAECLLGKPRAPCSCCQSEEGKSWGGWGPCLHVHRHLFKGRNEAEAIKALLKLKFHMQAGIRWNGAPSRPWG